MKRNICETGRCYQLPLSTSRHSGYSKASQIHNLGIQSLEFPPAARPEFVFCSPARSKGCPDSQLLRLNSHAAKQSALPPQRRVQIRRSVLWERLCALGWGVQSGAATEGTEEKLRGKNKARCSHSCQREHNAPHRTTWGKTWIGRRQKQERGEGRPQSLGWRFHGKGGQGCPQFNEWFHIICSASKLSGQLAPGPGIIACQRAGVS